MTPGATTKLAGTQHGGVLTGMLFVAFAASAIGGPILVRCDYGRSGLSSLGPVAGRRRRERTSEQPFPLQASVFALGVSNGAFASRR